MKIKRTVSLLLLFILLVSLFASCAPKADEQTQETATRTYADFTGKKLGSKTGTIWEQILPEHLQAELAYYSETSAGVEDVRKGRIDGFVTDLSQVRALVAAEGNEDLTCMEIPAEIFSAPMGAVSLDQDIVDRFNIFIAEIEADGTLKAMQDRWLENVPDLDSPMPDIPLTGGNGILTVATTAGALPFAYMGANGELKGYSIELARRFAAHEGMDIAFAEMEFGGMIPYIVSGKADLAIADITITEERKKSVLFTDSIYDDQGGIIALKQNGGEVAADTARDYTDFAGKTIGNDIGSVYGATIEDAVKGTPAFYSEVSSGIEDVRKGRIAGYMTDLSQVRVLVSLPENKDLDYVIIPSEILSFPMGAATLDQSLVDRFNAFLAVIRDDGTLSDMQNRWLLNTPDLDSPMPDIPLTGENGTLRIATKATAMPFSYMGANGEFKGFSMELIRRFAANVGMDISIADMEFGALIPCIVSGKADIAIADIFITEERKKSVLFTDPFFYDQGAIIALKTAEGAVDGSSYTDFSGKKFSILVGSVFDDIADRVFNASEKLYFNNVIDEIQAVHLGKTDAALLDHVVAMVNLSGGDYEDLTTTEVPLEELNFRYSVFSDKQEVIDKYNDFLRVIKENGTYDDMVSRWFDDYDNTRAVPDIPLTETNGVLKVALNASYPPFVYLGDNGKWSGFDIEQFYRFAEYLGMDIELIDMEFGAMLPYVISGKCDIASSIYYTDERAKSVIFGDADYYGKTVLVHKKTVAEPKTKTGFIQWIKTGIERNLITDNRWKMIVNGLGVTMIIAFFAQLFGTVFGCFVCWLLMHKNRFIRWIGNLYCGLIHGTPVVVLLMITYYIIFGNTDISSVLVAIAAFTMVEGAIIAQNLKGAIDTIDPVEIEAARSIGFSSFNAFMTVTLPQAVRRALPSYTNGFVELVKATAIVGYIAIQDLTRAGDIIRSRTYDAYFPILFIALIYLTVTTVCVQIFKLIVRKMNGGTSK